MTNSRRFSLLMVLFLSLFAVTSSNSFAAKKMSKKAKEIKSRLKNIRTDLIEFYKTGSNSSFASARVKLERLLVKYPENVSAQVYLGMIYNKRSQNIADSLAARTDVKARRFFQIGNMFLAQNRYEKALECYDKVLAKFPKWSCPHRHKGEVLMKMGKDYEAIAALERSVEVRKNHFDAYVWLAKAQVKVAKHEDAKKSLENGCKNSKRKRGLLR